MGRQIYAITYNSANRISRITDLAGRTTAYDYDATGNLIKVSAPLGPNSAAVTLHTYTYNSYHGLTTKTNTLSETYTIEYYPVWQDKGIVKRIINPVGTELIRNGQQPVGQEMSLIYDFGNRVFYYSDYRGATYKNIVNEIRFSSLYRGFPCKCLLCLSNLGYIVNTSCDYHVANEEELT